MPSFTSKGEATSELFCARASTCAVSSCCADDVPPDEDDAPLDEDDAPPDEDDDEDDIAVAFPADS
jgi:hypothetical protein